MPRATFASWTALGPAEPIPVGPYLGEIAARYAAADLLACLADLPSHLASPQAQILAAGRNRNVRVELPVNGKPHTFVVKAFGRESFIADLRNRRRGTKAARSYLAATHLDAEGVGTPAPVAYLTRRSGGRLLESYYIAEYRAGVSNFGDAMLQLIYHDPECLRFIDLLHTIAQGARHMHDAGFIHRDFGNQNILLTTLPGGDWSDFQVIDLNRGRVVTQAGVRVRGQDLSRLNLPSGLMDLFLDMYWGARPPPALVKWTRFYRWLFSLHARSRRLRHPFREARLARELQRTGEATAYPADYPVEKDIWIWDSRTDQPYGALDRRARLKAYPRARYLRMLGDTLKAAGGVFRTYRGVIAGGFRQPVNFHDRIGMAVTPDSRTWHRQFELLRELGAIPVIVRIYHHEDKSQRAFKYEAVHALAGASHAVTIALVQDRRAVNEPDSWYRFVVDVLDRVGPVIESVEVAHAVNRVKWGIWDFKELACLYRPLEVVHECWPNVKFMGPSAIDFEYPFLFPALKEWPSKIPLSALSHHLYVDRRGAPENPQNLFSSLEKFALARAIARWAPGCHDSVVISEVNWPIEKTGVYSPIALPFMRPEDKSLVPGVSELTYGAYMLRYLCLALGSGFVDRVYWWRLVSRGFGLIDDSEPENWRRRPAFIALRTFLTVLGTSTLVNADLPARRGNRHGRYRFFFERPDGERIELTWVHGAPLLFPRNESFARIEDALGNRLDATPEHLDGQPVYLRRVGA